MEHEGVSVDPETTSTEICNAIGNVWSTVTETHGATSASILMRSAQMIYVDLMLTEPFATRLATATTRSLGGTGFATWVS